MNQPTKPPSVADDEVVDVALKGGGAVTGRVVDVRGAAVASAVVSIRQSGREVSRTLSDEEGRYVVNNLRGGVYRIVVAGDARVFRFWAMNTAPPSAGETAISVVGNTVVCRRRGVTNTPLAENVFAAIAAAIGRPISPGNDDKPPAGL